MGKEEKAIFITVYTLYIHKRKQAESKERQNNEKIFTNICKQAKKIYTGRSNINCVLKSKQYLYIDLIKIFYER